MSLVTRYCTTLGGDAPKGGPANWAPICGADDCDALVTIVTPWFRVRDGSVDGDPAAPACRSLAALCTQAGLGDAAWYVEEPGRAAFQGWDDRLVAAGEASSRVMVRVLCVSEAFDLVQICRDDAARGACATALLLHDPARWEDRPLGAVGIADGAVIRTTIRERCDAFVADCDVSVIRDRQVFRAKFTIPWVERQTLRTLGIAMNLELFQSDTEIFVGPCAARWVLVRVSNAR